MFPIPLALQDDSLAIRDIPVEAGTKAATGAPSGAARAGRR